ncbi:MAG: glycosyltransferase family 39 protein [Bacteroidota bacterium]|nr:glycosyltransferase family 39 protein [Bacteroidota bacterium]
MKENLDILRSGKTGNIIVISIILVLVVLSLFRLYPFENSLKDIVNGKDDWNRYARFALDIKHNGVLIKSVNGVYKGPGGFLYNYFVALCFLIFGENNIPIYIIQIVLLGFSIAFIYWTFRDKMNPFTGFAFLLTMFSFALVDVYKNYSFRLLSENLGVFTVSLFFFFFIKGIEKNKLSFQICSAFFLVFSILTRPNIFPFGLAFIIILIAFFLKQEKPYILKSILFALFFLSGMSIIAFRNYIVCGSWTFLPTYGTSSVFALTSHISLSYLLKKVLFCLGFLTTLNSEYLLRPHWVLMWIGYFIYIFLRIKDKTGFEIWELTVHLFILLYYGLSIISLQIGSYGFRIFIPVIFIVLAFSFMAVDRLMKLNINS